MKYVKQLFLCSLISMFFVGEVQLSGGRTQVIDDEKHQCRICMCRKHEENEMIPRATGCGHLFHVDCLRKWFAQDPEQKCPICKRMLDEHFDMVDKPDLPGFHVTRFDDDSAYVQPHDHVSSLGSLTTTWQPRYQRRNRYVTNHNQAFKQKAFLIAGLVACVAVGFYKMNMLGTATNIFTKSLMLFLKCTGKSVDFLLKIIKFLTIKTLTGTMRMSWNVFTGTMKLLGSTVKNGLFFTGRMFKRVAFSRS